MQSVRPRPPVAYRPLPDHAANDLLVAALGSTDYGVMITGLDHTTLAVNERFGELWGVDIHQVVRMDSLQVRELVQARIPDWDAWVDNLQRVYEDAERVQEDTIHLVNPGLTMRRFTGPVHDANGTAVGRIWTFQDFSANERRLRRSQLLQNATLMADPQPQKVYAQLVKELSEFYDSLCFLSINQEGYMLFRAIGAPEGHMAHSMPGNNLQDAFCQFCLESNGPILVQNALEDPRYRTILPATLGLTRYAGVPLFSPSGEILGTLCLLDGHSEVILDEEDLQVLGLIAMRISSELDREKHIKSLELDLEEAQQRAIRNEKLAITGTLSASIAHDIRNILTAMKLDINAGPDAIHQHIDRFSLLAHRLLSYAKPNQMVKEPVDVLDSLNRVLALLHPHAQIARIKIEFAHPPSLPPVYADNTRLDHLFVNLILNAIQAMGRNGQLVVRVDHLETGVQIAIQDSGPGMTTEQIKNLFEPFKSTRSDGFGLGLFSARQIAEECGGSITVESKPGAGAVFTIWLPYYESPSC